MNPGIIALVVVLGIGVLVVVFYAQKRHREKLTAWAAAHGFGYEARNDSYADLPWGRPFGVGQSRRATDVFTGTVSGRPAICFDYQYTTTSGSGENQSTSTSHYSMFWIRLPKSLGELRVAREGVGSRLARAVGVHDIELESEDFNRTFSVRADDRKFAYDVLNPQLMQWLLARDAPGFQLIGADLVLVHQGRLRVDEIEPQLGYLSGVADRIPEIVWNET